MEAKLISPPSCNSGYVFFFFQKFKRAKAGNLQRNSTVQISAKQWMENSFTLFSSSGGSEVGHYLKSSLPVLLTCCWPLDVSVCVWFCEMLGTRSRQSIEIRLPVHWARIKYIRYTHICHSIAYRETFYSSTSQITLTTVSGTVFSAL